MQRVARALARLGPVGVVLGLAKYHAKYIGEYDLTGTRRFAWSLAYIALLVVGSYGAGLPDLVRSRRSAIGAAVAASLGAALGISVAQLATGSGALLPRFVVFGSAAVLVVFWWLCSELAKGGRAWAEERDRVVVVAEPPEVELLRDDLAQAPERNAQVVASLTGNDAAGRGDARPLVDAVLQARGTVVVLGRSGQGDDRVVAQAAALHEHGIRVRTLSLFYEEWLGKLPIAELERVSLFFDIGELHRVRYGRLKRVLDVLVSVPGCAALLVTIPVVWVGNVAGNRGPLFYRQDRVGRGGRTFSILKFRTMRPAGVELPNEWTAEDDPRITPFGGILRRLHLDELPQVINILRGDLSLVGPRPEQPRYVAELVTKIPFYDLRHLVRPGLTGWAQVKYGYAGSESDALEKLQYDFFYLRRQSLLLDMRITGRTIRSVVRRAGR